MANTITTRVENELRSLIVRRVFTEGEVLNEKDLSERFEVSVTPVHQALVRLEAEGLVKMFAKRGAQIATLSFEDVQNLIEFRELIESYAIRRITSMQASGHSKAIDLITQSFDQDPYDSELASEAFLEADTSFHERIVNVIDNPIMLASYRHLRARLNIVRFRALQRNPERQVSWAHDHEEIAVALKNRDADLAIETLRGHIHY